MLNLAVVTVVVLVLMQAGVKEKFIVVKGLVTMLVAGMVMVIVVVIVEAL